jgi:hypothetical protein
LESLVAERFLAIFGDLPVTEEESVESPRGNLREVEEALAAVMEQMSTVEPGTDEDEILQEQRKALYRERQRMRALPSAPSVRIRQTGETFAEVWERSDVLERNRLLTSQVAEVHIRKGSRGRHGLDPNRVGIQWKGVLAETAGAEEIVPIG